MILRFNNPYLEYLAKDEKPAGKPKYDKTVIVKFKRTLKVLNNAKDVGDLKNLRGLNFEALKGNWKGYHSVRVDYKYRLVFKLQQDVIMVAQIIIIEDLTNHYQ